MTTHSEAVGVLHDRLQQPRAQFHLGGTTRVVMVGLRVMERRRVTVIVRMRWLEALEGGCGAWCALRSSYVEWHNHRGEVRMGHWHLRDWEWH